MMKKLPAFKNIKEDDFSVQTLITDLKTRSFLSTLYMATRSADVFAAYAAHMAKHATSVDSYIKNLEATRTRIIDADRRHSIIRNTLYFMFPSQVRRHTTPLEIATTIQGNYERAKLHFRESQSAITDIGVHKIKKGSVVLLFGYSQKAINIIIEAHHRGNKCEVYVAECRPLDAGRKVSQSLSRAGISSQFITDSHLRYAIKKSDIVFLGIESIDASMKSYATMGSELVCELADIHKTPTYVCMDSWQFDPARKHIVEDEPYISPEHIWTHAPAGVDIVALAYEKIDAKLIRGFICELGIYDARHLAHIIRMKYPMLF